MPGWFLVVPGLFLVCAWPYKFHRGPPGSSHRSRLEPIRTILVQIESEP